MDPVNEHEASDDDSDQKYPVDGADTSKAEAALKAKLSRKRTKTGCLTCRKRRIKCGEERPVCKNCIKSKRHCEGYSQRVLFKPPTYEYRAAPNGGAHITFQAGPMAMPMMPMHPGQMPQYMVDPNAYPDLVPRPDQQFMPYLQQPVNSFGQPLPQQMPFSGYPMPSQPVPVQQPVSMAYNQLMMNGQLQQPQLQPQPQPHQQQQQTQQQPPPQTQAPFMTPLTSGYGTQQPEMQQQQPPFQPSFTTARTQPISAQSLPASHFQTPTQIPRAYSGSQQGGVSQPQPALSGQEASWPSMPTAHAVPASQPPSASISPPQKFEPVSTPSQTSSQSWAAPTYTPRPELSRPIDYQPHVAASRASLPSASTAPLPPSSATTSQFPPNPTSPELYEYQTHFQGVQDQSQWLAAAAVEVVDDDYWDVDSEEDMDIDKPTAMVKDSKRQRTLNKVLMGQHFNAQRTYNTFLQEGMLEHYKVEWHANPLRNPATARVFAHFISATGPSLSTFERRTVRSSILSTDGLPSAQQSLWTHTMPMAALHHQGLLHAMLALSSLHIARLQNGDTTPSMKHYAWALKRIHNCVSSRKKRLGVTTIAASMLLGFYEVMTADHMKWNTHLAGAKQLFVETDFAGMTRQYRQLRREKMAHDQSQLRRNSISAYFNRDEEVQSQFYDVDEATISTLVGREVRYEDQRGYIETAQTKIPKELDLSNFEILKDLFWWYCKQDAYQSIVSGNPLL